MRGVCDVDEGVRSTPYQAPDSDALLWICVMNLSKTELRVPGGSAAITGDSDTASHQDRWEMRGTEYG
jgi:hypothetical protein